MSDVVLDSVVDAETPEGILLQMHPAGLTARCYAFLLDWLIRQALLIAVAMVLVRGGGTGKGLFLIIYFLLEWFYPVVFELASGGATPGKRAMRLKVVMDSGLPITPAASITRNLLRAADFLPFFFGFAIISMLVRKDFKRLGDLAASTLVVYRPRMGGGLSLTRAAPVAPSSPLSLRDQTALMSLAARAPTLTFERVDELAALAARAATADTPGAPKLSGPELTRRVLGIGHWLLGQRP